MYAQIVCVETVTVHKNIFEYFSSLHVYLKCVCVYPQCAEATESLQHAVVDVFQSVGGQNQLIDP